MAIDPTLENATQERVSVHVRVQDAGMQGYRDVELPSQEFDANERGIQLGSVFVPWHRVIQYDWKVRQDFVKESAEGHRWIEMRVTIDDGTATGTTHVVPASRFEAGTAAITLIIDDRAEPQSGSVVVRKLFIPWHRVLEYERVLRLGDGEG